MIPANSRDPEPKDDFKENAVGEKHFAGVDIGTQGTKCAIYSRAGIQVAEAFQTSVLTRPGPGMVEEDPEIQFASACSTIRACVEGSGIDPSSVACLAIDGQMAGTIGIGADGRALTPYDSWLDTRCAPYMARMKAVAGLEIQALTGNAPSFNQGPKLLYWKYEHPEIWKRIVAFVQPGAYASMRLCGLDSRKAYVDETYLHFSGFADNAKAIWDSGLCREFGVDENKLPRIAKPAEIIGAISGESARLCGLREGTPLAAGLGDTAASFLSCGATSEGICVDVAGTASVFASTSSSFVPDTRELVMGIGRSALPGLWHPYAYINGGGMNILWFAGKIAPGIGLREGRGSDAAIPGKFGTAAAGQTGESPGSTSSGVDFDDLDALVRGLEPRMDDPWFIPHMEGRVMPADPGMRGAWAGLRWNHGLDRLYRAVLEGAAFEYRVYLESLRRLYPGLGFKEVRITGGGAKSLAWTATKADVLGLPFRAIRTSGGAPMGAAMLAACASGADSGGLPALARLWISYGDATEPDPERCGLYARRFSRYERLLGSLSGFPDGKED
jgi:xylulokinase